MTRPFHRPASLPGLLARYLLLTAALGILAAVPAEVEAACTRQ